MLDLYSKLIAIDAKHVHTILIKFLNYVLLFKKYVHLIEIYDPQI